MNFETIKTVVLTLLVAFSLVLTFSLWNSQPNLDYISNHPEYVNEVDIGGREESKKTIIQPDHIVFHLNDKYYGLETPNRKLNLYKQMLDWELDHLQMRDTGGLPMDDEQVEVIFPTTLPAEVIRNLFTVSDRDELPTWSFKNFYITFQQASQWLKITIPSTDGQQKIEYTVKNTSAYNHLQSLLASDEELSEYVLFADGRDSIYLPLETVKMKNHSITVQTIDSYLLVNALFTNPSNVRPNIGEASFSDGQRGMQILNEGRNMEYINPIHSNGEFMNPLLLLEQSLDRVNEHKGWTNDFGLVDIDILNNAIYYRMHYEGYPIFSRMRDNDVSVIEQRFLNQELHLYKRPLFKLDSLLGGETIELTSGRKIIEFLKANDYYDQKRISDIKVGYKLIYLEGTSYSLTLVPAWYMKYRGNWIEIRVDEFDHY